MCSISFNVTPYQEINFKSHLSSVLLCKLPLSIVMISSILDVGGVSGSPSGKEWNTLLDLKLKFAILSITYLGEGGAAQKLREN